MKFTNPGSSLTYAGLRLWLDTLTPEQLAMTAHVYAGDVDDTMPVFGTCFNSDEEMGESMPDAPVTMPFLLI